MKNQAFAFLLFINGLILGAILGKMIWIDFSQPSPGQPPPNRYLFHQEADGRMSFFDQATGRHISFHQIEGLWFVMTHDPERGAVTYQRTELLEDPEFLKAAEKLKNDLPGRLGRDLELERLIR